METLIAIQAATIAARTRFADNAIATRAEAGRIQVVRVNYTDDKAKPIPLSRWMPVSQVVSYLSAM